MKNKIITIRRIFLILICSAVSLQYIVTLSERMVKDFFWYPVKPFAGRALLPMLAGVMPFEKDTSILILVFIFCIGLSIVMLAFREKYHPEGLGGDVFLIVSYFAFMVFISVFAKTYDAPTAFFFTLIVFMWSNGKIEATLPVFFILTINRETSLFLIPVFVMCHYGRVGVKRLVKNTLIMAFLYALARYFVLLYTVDAAGTSVWYNINSTVAGYSENIEGAILLFLLFSMYTISIKRTKKDGIVNIFILVTFPVLFALHMLCGMPFEIRTFAEVFPVMILGMANSNPSLMYKNQV